MKLSKNELTLKLIDLIREFTTQEDTQETINKALKDNIVGIDKIITLIDYKGEDEVYNLNLVKQVHNNLIFKFSLKGKINALYDDITVAYKFDKEEVLDNTFIPLNINILIPTTSNDIPLTIPVVEDKAFSKQWSNNNLLDSKFCDFKNLTLEDLEELKPEIKRYLIDKIK